MIASLLLTSTLAVGQPPAAPQAMPTAQAPAPVVPATPAPPSPTGTTDANTQPTGTGTQENTDEANKEPEKEPTKYFLERRLGDTVAGRFFSENGLKLYGWTQVNYTGSSASRSNLPVALNDRANYFQMNQNYLIFEKAVDTEKKETQFGFQFDFILPGTDARYTVPRGFLDNQLRSGANGAAKDYPIDVFQMYGTVFLPDIGQGTTVKVGRFATHVGYETVQAVSTPFVSRSYLFQYNPFSHTGVFATTQLSDDWSVSNGVALGADNYIDPASRTTYLGQVRWAPKDGDTTLAFNTVVTRPRYNQAEAFAFYNVYDVVLTHKVCDDITYAADATYSHMEDFPGQGNTTAQWYGLAQYLTLQHCEQLATNVRVELFQDDQGVRTGTRGLYTAVTYGLNWTPTDDFIIRPFARYDFNRNGPFEGKQNLYTGGIEAIVRW